MNKKSLIVFKFLLFFGLLAESSTVQSFDNGLVPVTIVCGALVASSGLKGVYNIRHYNKIVSQCDLDYELSHTVNFLQYPLQVVQNIVCTDSQELDMTDKIDHGTCMTEVKNKINLFDSIDLDVIWNFEKFKDTFPHTDFQSAYCVSRNYMGSFGYRTLGALRYAVSYQIFKIENDFNQLIRLTSLSSSTKMPKTLDEFNDLKLRLSTYSNYYGAYGWLGMCGYSCLHNSQKIKDCLLSLSKIHAFLINFQELLKTSVDADETLLINSSGLLNFSLQHVHQVQKRL